MVYRVVKCLKILVSRLYVREPRFDSALTNFSQEFIDAHQVNRLCRWNNASFPEQTLIALIVFLLSITFKFRLFPSFYLANQSINRRIAPILVCMRLSQHLCLFAISMQMVRGNYYGQGTHDKDSQCSRHQYA